MPTWTDNMTIQFLNEIRDHPELWDVDNLVYKNREAKKQSWAQIAAKFGVTPVEAYAKFKNLRTYARNEHKKHQGKQVVWFAYDAISFLFPPNVDVITDSENATRNATLDWTSEDESVDTKDPLILLSVEGTYKKAKTNKHQETQTQEKSNEYSEKNVYSCFGEHVANKLNGYDRYTRAQVEFQISKILYDADMGLFSKG